MMTFDDVLRAASVAVAAGGATAAVTFGFYRELRSKLGPLWARVNDHERRVAHLEGLSHGERERAELRLRELVHEGLAYHVSMCPGARAGGDGSPR